MAVNQNVYTINFCSVCYLAGEFARMLIKKFRAEQEAKNGVKEGARKQDERNILCVQIAGLCHNLGMCN